MQQTLDVAHSEKQYFTVSQYKLAVLYVMTLGLYSVYWFYRNWKHQQPYMDKKISPVWRAIFSIFFIHSLYHRIRETAQKNNIAVHYNFNVMATLYVVFIVASSILGQIESSDEFGLISVVSMAMSMMALYPVYIVQDTINQINNDPHGVFNNEMTIANYLFIAAGAVLWFLLVVAALAGIGAINI